MYKSALQTNSHPLWCSAYNSFDLMFSTQILWSITPLIQESVHTHTHTHTLALSEKQWVFSYGCLSHSNYMMCANCRSFMHPLQTYFKEIWTHPEPQLASTAQAPEKQHGRRNDPIVLHLPSQSALTVCRGTPALLLTNILVRHWGVLGKNLTCTC